MNTSKKTIFIIIRNYNPRGLENTTMIIRKRKKLLNKITNLLWAEVACVLANCEIVL